MSVDDAELRQLHRLATLRLAAEQLVRLMYEYEVDFPGQLADLGVENPFEEVAREIIEAHEHGKLTDAELRSLGIAEHDGQVVIAVHPFAFLAPAGCG